jgi:steroid delta-isomerase-like uncharacterized protein
MATELEKMFRDYCAAWKPGNWDAVSSFLTDDCVLEDLGTETIYHGKKEIKKAYDDFMAFSSDLKLEIKSIFVSGTNIGCQCTMAGTNNGNASGIKATGKKFSLPVASIVETRDGKICQETDYSNASALLKQLGWLPGAPANWMGRFMIRLMTKRQ